MSDEEQWSLHSAVSSWKEQSQNSKAWAPRHTLLSCHLSLSPLEQQHLLFSTSEALQSIGLGPLQSRLLESPAAIQTFEVTVPGAV